MNPIVSILTQAIIPMVTSRATRESGKTLEKADVSKIEREVAAAIEGNTELKNLTNQEAPWQSRVAWGGATAVIGALGVIVPMVARFFGLDITADQIVEVGGAIMTLCGAIYSLYGRFGSFTAPLFERRRV